MKGHIHVVDLIQEILKSYEDNRFQGVVCRFTEDTEWEQEGDKWICYVTAMVRDSGRAIIVCTDSSVRKPKLINSGSVVRAVVDSDEVVEGKRFIESSKITLLSKRGELTKNAKNKY